MEEVLFYLGSSFLEHVVVEEDGETGVMRTGRKQHAVPGVT